MLRIDLRSPIYPVDPGITLGEFERLIMGESYEVAGVFGQDERLILAPKQGVTDFVAFTEDEGPYLADATVTHNHPTGSVFSYDDATLATDQNLYSLRAVCPDGTIYLLERPSAGWPPTDSMLLVVEKSLLSHRVENERRRRSGASILRGRDRDALMFVEQRGAFAGLGVRMEKTNAWRR